MRFVLALLLMATTLAHAEPEKKPFHKNPWKVNRRAHMRDIAPEISEQSVRAPEEATELPSEPAKPTPPKPAVKKKAAPSRKPR